MVRLRWSNSETACLRDCTYDRYGAEQHHKRCSAESRRSLRKVSRQRLGYDPRMSTLVVVGKRIKSLPFLRLCLIAALLINGLVLLTSPDFTRDIEANSFNRFYYHTLPVVLSAMEFGHDYDHTAKMLIRNAVWSIPINTKLDSVINQVIENPPPRPPPMNFGLMIRSIFGWLTIGA